MDQIEFKKLLLAVAEKNNCTEYFEGENADIFSRLTEHMLKVNETFNLTGLIIPENIALLHYVDCIKVVNVFPKGAHIVDIGAGAGFPTLPLAICRPDLEIIAVDATAKRMRYVEDTAKMLGLSNVKTLTARAEDLGRRKEYREKFEYVTARAVGHLPALSELCLPLVKQGGHFVALKGKEAEAEITSAKNAINLLGARVVDTIETPLSFLDGEICERITVVIKKERATPMLYPRPYAKIHSHPL